MLNKLKQDSKSTCKDEIMTLMKFSCNFFTGHFFLFRAIAFVFTSYTILQSLQVLLFYLTFLHNIVIANLLLIFFLLFLSSKKISLA